MVIYWGEKVTLMLKKNYRAWQINANDFPHDGTDTDKLLFFAHYAILAPSGHNTQPWAFVVEEGSLLLQVSPERDLPFSGALAAEPHVSLGSCLETFNQAALGFGYSVAVDYLFETTSIARLTLGKKRTADSTLLNAIVNRVSNRSLFKSQAVSSKIIQNITNNELVHVSFKVVEDQVSIEYLADKTREATSEIMTKKEFRDELSKWVRNNLTKQYDGMPGFVQGMPTPPSLLAKYIVKNVDISKGQSKLDAKRVKHSPAVILISAHDSSPQAYLEVGRLYAKICIQAQQQNVATSGVGAAVISSTTKQQIADHFNLKFPPTALIRLGYATKPARHTPRWPIDKVSR